MPSFQQRAPPYAQITYGVADSVAWVGLSRPEARNAVPPFTLGRPSPIPAGP